MKKYNKRINIWVDEDFESDIKVLKKFIENEMKENCGKISTSDAIRIVVKEWAKEYKDFKIYKNIEN